MDTRTAKVALTLVREGRARYAEYLEECAEDRKRGFRPRECEHGTNQWTDYDNICGGCENGETFAYGTTIYRYALDTARLRVELADKLINAWMVLRNAGIEVDADDVAANLKALYSA